MKTKNFIIFILAMASMVLLLTSCGCEHEYSDATCTSLATCTKCGATTGELAAHEYSEATCTSLSACIKCAATTGELAAHEYSDATCTELAACLNCGVTTGDFSPHLYSDATCIELSTCTECGAVTGDYAEHEFSDATCQAPATCTVCGLTNGSALPHSFTNATCTSPKTCTVCGTTSGNPLPHTNGPATCKVEAVCTVCNQKTGVKGDHSYTNGVCSVCGAQDQRYAEVAAVLNKIERYPSYLKIDVSILETRVDLYRLNKTATRLLDIVEKVDEMYDYVQKIKSNLDDSWEYKILKDACDDVEYPGTAPSTSGASSYLSKVNNFKRDCTNVYIAYGVIAKNYGINWQ